MAASSKAWAVIAGAGPGTSSAIAHRLASHYRVALLSRSPDSYNPIVTAIKSSGGHAIGISTDVSSAASVKAAFSKIEAEFGADGAAVAVFNASSGFARKSILELSEAEFGAGLEVSVKGAFNFTQAVMPHLLRTAEAESQYPPTLIYTGATASIKSSALMAAFSVGKHAMRALAFSVAREFGPKGVHVAHAVIDGIIDTPGTKDWTKDTPMEGKINPDGVSLFCCSLVSCSGH